MDEVTIYNLACSSVTTTSSIADTTEDSPEANECALWYELVRDWVLESAMWPCATQTSRLALLSTRDNDLDWASGDPLPGYLYAYGRPSDMLRPRYLTSFAQFNLGLRNDTPAIMTNQSTALLVYTKRQTVIDTWDRDLQLCVIHTLAAKIARKLTGSRSKMLDNFNIANEMILQARANARNQLQGMLPDFAPSALVARGASGLNMPTPYIYRNAEFALSGFDNLG